MLLISDAQLVGRPREDRASVLVAEGIVSAVGVIDAEALRAAGVDVEIVDAAGSLLAPGIVLPRTSLTEEIPPEVTTWVGVASSSFESVPHAVLARVRQARQGGASAWMWSGGNGSFLTRSAGEDIALIAEVIGIGELFFSDLRSSEPSALELARIASEGHLASLETGKAGLLHLSVGNGKRRMARLFEAIRSFDVEPSWFYATLSNPAA
ncbi:MAG TPA: hypothetical protein VFL80_00845, partial [Thermoanaerobaculia bacterium]|nr:hypothetical protein [Thermoanaerobaculia bacterium]